ncbi:MAG: glycine cleavage system protein GcvH [Rhodospirillales bacterium]|jgi:glycine cleavage system H protein|nr:glycine cleavage system protein GcvH [Rhodospirillales bacterium]
MLCFTREHEWISVTDDEEGTVGITDYAQKQLGDVVFVELPEVGSRLLQGAQAAVVESVKAASEVYAPASGEVIAVNTALAEDPARVNTDAMGAGWFFKIRLDDPGELAGLLSEGDYREHVEALH